MSPAIQAWLATILLVTALIVASQTVAADTVRIVALGDSLTAGYGLAGKRAFRPASKPN
jgi:lysophospholipase L1-like esterase